MRKTPIYCLFISDPLPFPHSHWWNRVLTRGPLFRFILRYVLPQLPGFSPVWLMLLWMSSLSNSAYIAPRVSYTNLQPATHMNNIPCTSYSQDAVRLGGTTHTTHLKLACIQACYLLYFISSAPLRDQPERLPLSEICCATAPCGIGIVPAPSALCTINTCAIGTMHHPHREMCFIYSGSGLVVYNALVAGLLRLSLLIAH